MLIVSKGTVVHDGKEYHSGELINDITAEQRDRLVSLGVCQYAPEQPAAVNAIPGASAAGGTQPDAGNAEKQSDAETLHLNVDPAKAIQADKKK